MDFTQTQATQGMSAPKVTCASEPTLYTSTRIFNWAGASTFASSAVSFNTIIQQHRDRLRV